MSSSFPYQFLAFEGNIGTGKTTLCRRLASEEGAELILEEFTDNPFLQKFYDNPDRYALQVELFFLSERYKQLNTFPIGQDLFDNTYISDYIFVKSLLFASRNLSGHEIALFRRIFDIVQSALPQPDIIFYLHRPVGELMELIKKRNRPYEKKISPDYLNGIQSAYFSYFETIKNIPVVIVDCSGLDFENRKKDWNYIIDLVSGKYHPGITYSGEKGSPLFE